MEQKNDPEKTIREKYKVLEERIESWYEQYRKIWNQLIVAVTDPSNIPSEKINETENQSYAISSLLEWKANWIAMFPDVKHEYDILYLWINRFIEYENNGQFTEMDKMLKHIIAQKITGNLSSLCSYKFTNQSTGQMNTLVDHTKQEVKYEITKLWVHFCVIAKGEEFDVSVKSLFGFDFL